MYLLVFGHFLNLISTLNCVYSNTDLGRKLAELHLSNQQRKISDMTRVGGLQLEDSSSADDYVSKFGFHTTTCCGLLPLNNDWSDNWVQFYTIQRIQDQLNRIQSNYSERIDSLWSQLQRKIPVMFPAGLKVTPSLLHGDLWAGNAACVDGEPCIFDCASFYGHSEFDLAIACMFGGFSDRFFRAYHELIPKAAGFDNRLKFYKLFHYLNHWNQFGSGYRAQSLLIMRDLCNIT